MQSFHAAANAGSKMALGSRKSKSKPPSISAQFNVSVCGFFQFSTAAVDTYYDFVLLVCIIKFGHIQIKLEPSLNNALHARTIMYESFTTSNSETWVNLAYINTQCLQIEHFR